MRLSEYTTLDGLVLFLVKQGWRKTPDGNPPPDDPTAPFFTFHERFHPVDEQRQRWINLYPQGLDHHDDLGFMALIDESGCLVDWAFFSCHTGTITFSPVDASAVQMDRSELTQRLSDWLAGMR